MTVAAGAPGSKYKQMVAYLKSNFFTFSMLILVLGFIAYQRLPVYLETRELVERPAPDLYLPLWSARLAAGSDVAGETDAEFQSVDGRTVRLSELRGKKVLLNFWATWCGPCVREIPELTEVYAELRGENFEMLSITADDPGTLQRFAKNNPMNYPVVLDPTGAAHEAFRVRLFPTMVWIDEQGNIESFGHGADYILKQKIRYWVTGSIFEANP